MIPSVDTRLASMTSSVTGVIAPALAGTDPFAEEQAALLAGHLQVLRGHQPVVDEFEQLDYNRSRALARDLVAVAEGGDAVAAATRRVRDRLDAPVPFGMAALRLAQDELSAATAELVRAGGEDGTPAFVASSTDVVLAYERPHSIRLRSYFSAMGYETGETEIPAIEDMMAEFRSRYAAPAS